MTPVELHLRYPENRIRYCLKWIEQYPNDCQEWQQATKKRLYECISEADQLTHYD